MVRKISLLKTQDVAFFPYEWKRKRFIEGHWKITKTCKQFYNARKNFFCNIFFSLAKRHNTFIRVTWSLIACRVVALRFCFTCYNEPMRGFEFFMTLHRCIAYMCIGLCVSFSRGSNKGKCHITPPVRSSWTNSPRHLPKNVHLYWLWFEFYALLDRH